MRMILIFLVVMLAILHQDVWWWDDPTLVFGFMPIGLAYHALYSVLAACVWALAVKFAWPTHLESYAEGGEDAPADSADSAEGAPPA